MGNADLRDIAHLTPAQARDFADTTIAIDAHFLLYRYVTSTVRWADAAEYTTDDGMREVPNLIGLLRGLPRFFDHNIIPVFVFDGERHTLKSEEVARRKEAREKNAEKAAEAVESGNAQAARRYKSQSQSLTEAIHESTRGLLTRLGIPVVDAPGAGEAQAAYLTRTEEVNYTLTDDYDSLLFGAHRTIRQFTGDTEPEVMEFNATLDQHNLSWKQLVDLAILLGTDYNDGVYGVGPVRALEGIKEHGGIEGVLEEYDATVPNVETIRELYLDCPTAQYVSPTRLSPDFHAARDYAVEWGLDSEFVNQQIARMSAGFDS